MAHQTQVTVVGGGFTGLSIAYELVKLGIKVSVLEADREIGGLAGAFDVGGEKLDRFYHHWFTNDRHMMQLIHELNLEDHAVIHHTHTSVFYANRFLKLSTPWDLLKFTPLSFLDRIRLGLLVLRAWCIKDWGALENMTASQWIRKLGGNRIYEVLWQPLLMGKFGPYGDQISAVWFWNKLNSRGGSRGKGGRERLAYYKGGFVTLAEALADRIRQSGGRIELSVPVQRIDHTENHWNAITPGGVVSADRIVVTTALPLIADMVRHWAPRAYIAALERIRYLGNVCLILELDRQLSNSYWLNVNDPGFPFVGVIEHTNFVPSETYGGRHIVYLSTYLPHTDRRFSMNGDEFLVYAFPYLKKMFPAMERHWIRQHHIFRARWSQPVVERHYSRHIPPEDGPQTGFHVCSMAQIYPEDRGINYAIREGRNLGRRLSLLMK